MENDKPIDPKKFDRADSVTELSFDKSDVNNFKVWDIVEDKNLKTWIVHEGDIVQNTLALVKYPLLKRGNLFITLDLNKKEIVEKIYKVYR